MLFFSLLIFVLSFFLISILLFFFVSTTISKLDTMHAKVACLIFLLHVFISLETELSSNSVVRLVNIKSDNKMQIGMFKKR